MATTVVMNPEGRITLPASLRRELQLGEGAQFAVTLEDGKIVLTPVVTLPRWLIDRLSPEALARYLKAARPDPKYGVVFENLSLEDFIELEPEEERAAMRAEVARPGWPDEDQDDAGQNG
jgi:AbrB family looped-hinge helix DNA binding protein